MIKCHKKEQIESIAKYATYSYFLNLEEQKKELMLLQEIYVTVYTIVYLQALDAVTKVIQKKKDLLTNFMINIKKFPKNKKFFYSTTFSNTKYLQP